MTMAARGTGRLRAIVIVLSIAGLVALGAWALFGSIPLFLAFQGFATVHDDLLRLTGFSGYVVNALAAVAVAVLLLLYRSGVLRRLGFVAALAFIFVLYAVYQMGLFSISRETNFTSGGEGIRCYAVTQRGVVYSDRPGCDGQTEPVSGVRFAVISPDLVERLRQLEQNASGGGGFAPVDPDTRDWFHPLTKQPLLYYVRLADGSLEFFDAPGFHPGTSQALLAVTQELRTEYDARKDAVRRVAEQRIEAERAAVRAAEDLQRAEAAARQRAAQEKAAAADRARTRAEREQAARDADPSSRRAPATGEIYSY
jgi:hypothetical protein